MTPAPLLLLPCLALYAHEYQLVRRHFLELDPPGDDPRPLWIRVRSSARRIEAAQAFALLMMVVFARPRVEQLPWAGVVLAGHWLSKRHQRRLEDRSEPIEDEPLEERDTVERRELSDLQRMQGKLWRARAFFWLALLGLLAYRLR